MINILVPMAGRGRRFTDAGYNKPKPFIDVLGEPMISRVIHNILPEYECRYIFIYLKEFAKQYYGEFSDIINDFDDGNVNVRESEHIRVSEITEGAACTCLLAREHIDTDDELIIANCDQLVLDPEYMSASIDYYRLNNADGGVLCFLNNNPKWSYARLSGGRISQIVEKQVVSDIATVGIYYYATGHSFVQAATDMITHNNRVNNEFYVAPTYNNMIIDGNKVIPYMINSMVGLGIPEDLEAYVNL